MALLKNYNEREVVKDRIDSMLRYLGRSCFSASGFPASMHVEMIRMNMCVTYETSSRILVYYGWNQDPVDKSLVNKIQCMVIAPADTEFYLRKIHTELHRQCLVKAEEDALKRSTDLMFLEMMGFPPQR